MKNILIIIFLFCSFTGYSQTLKIEDHFTIQNWTEYKILTEDCTLSVGRHYDVTTGISYPVFLDEQGYIFYVTLVEGHVYTIDLQNLASNDE